MSYALENWLHLRWVESWLGHEDIKSDGQQPEGGNIELAGLRTVLAW